MKKELYLNQEFEIYCIHCREVVNVKEYLDVKGGYLQGIICDKCDTNLQMKSPSHYELHVYKEICKCGKENILMTQNDDCPEYHTNVYAICECGELLNFLLPVN